MAFIESISNEDVAALPAVQYEGDIVVVDTPQSLSEACDHLAQQSIIGFDTETRPCFGPNQPRYGVSLLQLSGPEKAYLFRVKDMGMHRRLCNLLADKRIIKVGAAIHDDIRGLQKLRDFQADGFVDLQKIVAEYGIRDKSVKKMTAIILGFRISKTQQLSNWEAETLSEAQCKYAATDAWVCREMYLKLMRSEKNPLKEEEKV